MKRRIHILFIEDSFDDVTMILHIVRKGGFDPVYTIVETADDLKVELSRTPWDIVIADYQMPKFNGTEALKMIRQHDPDLPFILVSGFIGEEHAVEIMIAGATDYVPKANLKRLVPAMKRSLREHNQVLKRREAEAAVRKSDKEWHEIFQAIGQPTIILDKDFNIIKANRRTLETTGLSEQELVGKKCYEIFHNGLPPNCPMRKMLVSNEHESMEMEVELFRGHFMVSCTPVLDESGQLEKVIHIATDISQLKEQEAESLRLKDQLVQAQKMEAVGRLAGGIAHDFNNLLTVILGNVQLAQYSNHANPILTPYLEQIQQSGERAAKLTRQLLSFSRKQPIQQQMLNLNELITGMLKMLKRLIGEDISIETSLQAKLPNFSADEGGLEQVIMNLVLNARDAMPDGGQITIRTELVTLNDQDCLNIPESDPGTYVRLTLQDTGIGMDESILGNIFEPFFSTKDQGQGTGLGLSVVYGILQQHKGFAKVESHLNSGTVFQLFFPFSNIPEQQLIDESKVSESPSGNGERILLVEDEDSIRSLFKIVLTRNNYQVTPACNAEEALIIFEEENADFQVLISDIILTGANGLDLAVQLKQKKPELKVILASGYLGDRVKLSSILKEGFTFIQKPIALPSLLSAIRKVLEK